MTDRQRNGFILLLVLGLVLGSLVVVVGIPGAVKSKKTVLGLDLKGGVELVYQGLPSPQTPHVTPDALQRAVDIMRSRVDQLGVAEPEIQTTGNNLITVGLPNVSDTARAEREVGSTAQLAFYDWEANALTPSGQPVAKLLQSQDQNALTISQGAGGSAGPGDPGSGSMGLYQAVQLAAKQTPWASASNSRAGPQYWLFGAPGSSACAAAARAQGTVPVTGQRCLLSGPDESITDLRAGVPTGVNASEGQIITVPRGWVVLEAISPSFAHCCASVMSLPSWVLAKPHCGDRHSCSRLTKRLAASMRSRMRRFSSRAPVLVVTRPSTTRFLPFGTKRSGSKPPARSLSYSRK